MKRRRTEYEYESYNNYPRVRRNYNKRIINVSQNGSGGTQKSTVLSTCGSNAAAFTFKLSSISIGATSTNATSAIYAIRWAIVIVRDGTTVGTINTTSGNSLYEPEQNVLTNGVIMYNPSIDPLYNETIYVKPSRKLQEGDEIRFISISSDADSSLAAEVTFVELYG